MEVIDKHDIKDTLLEAGLEKGQIVYIQSDLRKPGMVKGSKSREEFCKAYFDAIFEIIGENGTIVVPSCSTQVARFDIDFIWEETPSLMGIFSEYIRNDPQSLRSIHPVKSICAIGKNKETICQANSTNDYGWDSPFHRMLENKAKIVTIGLESGYVVGIAHHLEAAYCVPYVYNKLLKWSPIINGKRDERAFFSSVRHLNLNASEYDLTVFVKHVRSLGGIKSARLGGSWVHMADYEQVFSEGIRLLKENPYILLKNDPGFKYGEIPFDGPTGDKDCIKSQDDKDVLKNVNWAGYYLHEKSHCGGDEQENLS